MTDPLHERAPEPSLERPQDQLLWSAYSRNLDGVREAVGRGANVNSVHEQTGLSALHIAVGNNDRFLCRYLIEDRGAAFFPDGFGRWPTLVAIECGVDEDLADYIAEQESLFLQKTDQTPSIRDPFAGNKDEALRQAGATVLSPEELAGVVKPERFRPPKADFKH